MDRPAGPGVEAQRLHDGERGGHGEDLDVRGRQHAGVLRDERRQSRRWLVMSRHLPGLSGTSPGGRASSRRGESRRQAGERSSPDLGDSPCAGDDRFGALERAGRPETAGRHDASGPSESPDPGDERSPGITPGRSSSVTSSAARLPRRKASQAGRNGTNAIPRLGTPSEPESSCGRRDGTGSAYRRCRSPPQHGAAAGG